MELKRFDPSNKHEDGMAPKADGEWVRFSDVQALQAQLRDALAEYVHPYQSGTLTERERDAKARKVLGCFDVVVDEILPPGTIELRNRRRYWNDTPEAKAARELHGIDKPSASPEPDPDMFNGLRRVPEPSTSPAALTDEQRDAAYEQWRTAPSYRQYNKPGFDAGFAAARALLAASSADQVDAERWRKCKTMPKAWWFEAVDEAGRKGGRSLDESIDAAPGASKGGSHD